MRNNGPRGPSGKYASSEKYDRSSERHGGLCKANGLAGLEVCPHTGAGCTWRGTSIELSKHLATHVAAHLALVTQECRRQAEEIDRLRGKLEEASVGREVVIIIVVITITIMNMIKSITTLMTRVCLCGELVEWRHGCERPGVVRGWNWSE